MPRRFTLNYVSLAGTLTGLDKISGGKIPREYIQPTNQGIQSALDNGVLKPALRARGIVLSTTTPMRTFYLWINMEDPVVGGYTPEKIALRRAIGLAYDQAMDIRVLDHGMALAAQSPLPPAVRSPKK